MQKRGQFNISFSMIFSIIVIIAIIGIAFYVIRSFISLSKCTEISLFYNDLEEYIEEAWQSTIHQDIFPNEKYPATIPSGIELVCFGDIAQAPQEYNNIKKAFINSNGNVFLYPPQGACDSSLSSIKLEHVKTNEFFCIPVRENKIELKTKKDQFEALVTLNP